MLFCLQRMMACVTALYSHNYLTPSKHKRSRQGAQTFACWSLHAVVRCATVELAFFYVDLAALGGCVASFFVQMSVEDAIAACFVSTTNREQYLRDDHVIAARFFVADGCKSVQRTCSSRSTDFVLSPFSASGLADLQ